MVKVILGVVFVSLVILLLLIVWLFWVLGKKEKWLRESISHFECGLESSGNARSPLSIRFFFLLLLFLIFDMELMFLIFFFIDDTDVSIFSMEIMMIFFLLGMLGFFEEWRRGALAWVW